MRASATSAPPAGRRGFLAGMAFLAWLARERVAGAAAPAIGPALRFSVFGLRPLNDVAFVPATGQPPRRVQFPATARSPRYEYRGPLPLRFVDPASGAVVAEAQVPAAFSPALILFLPGTGAAGTPRHRVAVLDDGEAKWRAGQLAIVNLSGLALSGTSNDEPLGLVAGLNPPLPASRPLRITLRGALRGRSAQALATEVGLGRDERGLLLLFPPLRPGSLEVQHRLLVDRPAARVSR